MIVIAETIELDSSWVSNSGLKVRPIAEIEDKTNGNVPIKRNKLFIEITHECE